jgi:FG-GAP repeat
MRRVVVVVACVVGVLWLAPVTRMARAAPGLAPAVAGAAAGGAAVGGRSALADFNADTYADLAVGVPFEEDRSGVVNVIYGSESGLSATDTPGQIWRQGSPSVEGTPDSGDDFGFAVAST